MTPLFQIRGLSKSYAGQNRPALQIRALDIPAGQIVAIVGASGSGKTTLLNVLGGLDTFGSESDQCAGGAACTMPTVRLNLQDGLSYDVGNGASFPRQRVGYIFQGGYLLRDASVGFNLTIARNSLFPPVDQETLHDLCDAAQLDADVSLHRRVWALSGGQQQRVSFARALAREPWLVIADEPTSSLDPRLGLELMVVLKQWQVTTPVAGESRPSVLWVTHNYDLAAAIADSFVILRDGQVCDEVCPRGWQMLSNPDGGGVLCPSPELRSDPQMLVRAIERLVYTRPPPAATVRLVVRKSFAQNRKLPRPPNKLRVAWRSIVAGAKLAGFALTRPTSVNEPSTLRAVLTLPFRFTRWPEAVGLTAILALLVTINLTARAVDTFFSAQLRDPGLRHVVVEGDMQKSMKLSPAELRQIDCEIAGLDVGGQAASTCSNNGAGSKAVAGTDLSTLGHAFPRYTDRGSSLIFAESDKASSGEPTANVLWLDHAEPLLDAMRVRPLPIAEGVGVKNRGVALSHPTSAAQLLQFPDEFHLLVTERFARRLELQHQIALDADSKVSFARGGAGRQQPAVFTIVGVVENPPRDGAYHFDIISTNQVRSTWLTPIDQQISSSNSNAERVAIYFNEQNLSLVIKYLRDRGFLFDDDVVGKFHEMFQTSILLEGAFQMIDGFGSAILVLILVALAWNAMANNAKSIAVLRAQGTSMLVVATGVCMELLVTWIVAAGLVVVGAVAGMIYLDELGRVVGFNGGGESVRTAMVDVGGLPQVALLSADFFTRHSVLFLADAAGVVGLTLILGASVVTLWCLTHYHLASVLSAEN